MINNEILNIEKVYHSSELLILFQQNTSFRFHFSANTSSASIAKIDAQVSKTSTHSYAREESRLSLNINNGYMNTTYFFKGLLKLDYSYLQEGYNNSKRQGLSQTMKVIHYKKNYPFTKPIPGI